MKRKIEYETKFGRKHLLLLGLLLALLLLGGTAAYAATEINGASGIAIDYDTGEVLYAKDIDTMRVPASMTKIMTAYIIYEEMEQGNLTKESMIPVSETPAAFPATLRIPRRCRWKRARPTRWISTSS